MKLDMALEDGTLWEMYRRMILVRFMEETHQGLAREGRIHVNPHLGTGQEAVAIGVTGPLRKSDILFGTHRGVGEYIGKGMTPKDIWTEYRRNEPASARARRPSIWLIAATTSPAWLRAWARTFPWPWVPPWLRKCASSTR
ncbi:MAG: thiamine pyrophosphate-dependent enzyme [Burkholderiaceae bacterium]|nr:thiamine pyrophosphate-dependent enzyme [Burkholderiaceae bacterium]